MAFRLVDSNIYEMNGTKGRFYHLASVRDSIREYVCLIDKLTSKVYIEECTGGHLQFIEDDLLALELTKFLEEKGCLDPRRFISKFNDEKNTNN